MAGKGRKADWHEEVKGSLAPEKGERLTGTKKVQHNMPPKCKICLEKVTRPTGTKREKAHWPQRRLRG